MIRFFGMLPADLVTISKNFKDSNGFKIYIEACSEGWAIIWADLSTDYADEKDSPENNFKKAYDICVSHLGELTEWNKKTRRKEANKND